MTDLEYRGIKKTIKEILSKPSQHINFAYKGNYDNLTDLEYQEMVREDAKLTEWRKRVDEPRGKKLIQDHITEMGREGQYMKLLNLCDELMDAEEELFWRCKRYEKAKEKKRPYTDLAIIAYFIQQSMKELKEIEQKFKNSYTALFGTANEIEARKKNSITPEMIERAKEYPIDSLIDTRRGFSLCLFHNDTRPSMYTKNNFAHCFSCGKTADTIDVYREIHGTTFPEAVRALQ